MLVAPERPQCQHQIPLATLTQDIYTFKRKLKKKNASIEKFTRSCLPLALTTIFFKHTQQTPVRHVHVHAHLYHQLLRARNWQHVAAHFIQLHHKWQKHTQALHTPLFFKWTHHQLADMENHCHKLSCHNKTALKCFQYDPI